MVYHLAEAPTKRSSNPSIFHSLSMFRHSILAAIKSSISSISICEMHCFISYNLLRITYVEFHHLMLLIFVCKVVNLPKAALVFTVRCFFITEVTF